MAFPSPTLQNLTVDGVATLATASSPAITITGGTIDGTVIGGTTPAAAHATTLSTTGAATLASVATPAATITGGTIDGTAIGATTPAAVHALTLSTPSATITGGTINGTVIGGTTPEAITATTVTATSLTLPSQTANEFFASPNGANGAPTFRSLALADLPNTGTLNYLDFGAKCDGTTDDSAAFSALISACATIGAGVRVTMPHGVSIVKQAYTISTPILFVGAGIQAPAYHTIPAQYGSTLRYDGAALSTPFITLQNFVGGGMQGVAIDCNALAAEGIDIVAVEHASFDMAVLNYTNWGMRLGYSTTATNTATAWNTFGNLFIQDGGNAPSGKCALWITAMAGGGMNACHNTFENIHINHGGTCHGIYLGACDNNHFGLVYVFRNPSSTGYGIYVDPTEASGFPHDNTFAHTELMAGWYQPAGTSETTASIAFYAKDNGEPVPNLGVNGSLLLECANITYSYTTTTYTGITGTVSSVTVYYRKYGTKVDLRVEVAGTSVVVASNATIGGLPTTNGNAQGAVAVFGIQPNIGASTFGYQIGTTITLSQAVASFTGILILQSSFI